MESVNNNNNNDINKEDGEISSDDGDDNQEEFLTRNPNRAQRNRGNQTTQRDRSFGQGNDENSRQKGNVNQYGAVNSRGLNSFPGRGFKVYRESYNSRQTSVFNRSRSPRFYINRRFWASPLRTLRSPRRTIILGPEKHNRTSRHEHQRRKITIGDDGELERLKRERKKIRKQLKDLENQEISGRFDSIVDAIEALEESHESYDVEPDTDKQCVKTKIEEDERYSLLEESSEKDADLLSPETLNSQSVQEWYQEFETLKILATENPELALKNLVQLSKEWKGVRRDIITELIKDITSSDYQDAPEMRQDQLLTSANVQSIHDMPTVYPQSASQPQFLQHPNLTQPSFVQHSHTHPQPRAYVKEPFLSRELVEIPNNMSSKRNSTDCPTAKPFYDPKFNQWKTAAQTGNYLFESAGRNLCGANSRDSQEVDKSLAHSVSSSNKAISYQLHKIRNADEHHPSQKRQQRRSTGASLWKFDNNDSDVTNSKKHERPLLNYSSSFDDFFTSRENDNNQHVNERITGNLSSTESGHFDSRMEAGQKGCNYSFGIGSPHLSNEKYEYAPNSDKSLNLHSISRQYFARKDKIEREPVPPKKLSPVDHIIVSVSDSADQSGNNRRVVLKNSSKNRRSSDEQLTSKDIRYPSKSSVANQKQDCKLRVRPLNESSIHTPPTKKVKNDQPDVKTSKTPPKTVIDAPISENNHNESDSEDESIQRKKLIEDVERKREADNKAHQREITPSGLLPRLDKTTSELSVAPVVMMGTGEEPSVDHQDKVQSPSNVLNIFQEDSGKSFQSIPGLSLNYVKEPPSSAELCKIKLSPTESPYKLQAQDQQPVQEAVKNTTLIDEGTYIHKLDIGGTDAFIVVKQKHVTEDTSQLVVIEDTTTNEENNSAVAESLDIHKLDHIGVEIVVTTPPVNVTVETSKLAVIEDRTLNEENHSTTTESTDLSKLNADSVVTFVMKTETHVPEQISELLDIEDINRDSFTTRENHCPAADNLPKLEPEFSGAFFMAPQTHVPEEISQLPDVEDIITEQENHYITTKTDDLSKSNPDSTRTSVVSDKIPHIPVEMQQLFFEDRIGNRIVEKEIPSTTHEDNNNLSKLDVDSAETLVIKTQILLPEEISQHPDVEDRITNEKNQHMMTQGTDLSKLDLLIGTSVMKVQTHVPEKISQLLVKEDRITKQEIHSGTDEGKNLCEFSSHITGDFKVAIPSNVLEEISESSDMEDSRRDRILKEENDSTVVEGTDVPKLGQDGCGFVVMTNSEVMLLTPVIEEKQMEDNYYNSAEGAELHKLNHDSSVNVVMTNPTHSEEMSHGDVNRYIIKMEDIHCTGVEGTDQPTLDPDYTGSVINKTQSYLQEEMSQLVDVVHRNTKEENHCSATESTDLQNQNLNKIIETQSLVTEDKPQHSDVECRNRITKQENDGVKSPPKSVNTNSDVSISTHPVCYQNSSHPDNFEYPIPSIISSLRVSSIKPPTTTKSVNKAAHWKYQTKKNYTNVEFNSFPGVSSSSPNSYSISNKLQFLPTKTGVAKYATYHAHSKRKSVSVLEYPTPKKTTAMISSSKSVHQRLGPPVATAPYKSSSSLLNVHSWIRPDPCASSNKIQDAQHKARLDDQRELSSTQITGGQSFPAADTTRSQSRQSQVLASESSTFKTASVTQQSPEFQNAISCEQSRYSSQSQRSPVLKSTQQYIKPPELPVHPQVAFSIRTSSGSEDDSDGERDMETDYSVSDKVSSQFQRKDEKLNYLGQNIQADQTIFNTLKEKEKRYRSLRGQVENSLDKLRRQMSTMCFHITASETLLTTYKTLENNVQKEIQNFLKGQKNPNSKEVQSAVSSRLTPQDETGNTTLPDSDPPKESCTTKKQDLTKAEQMALKKQMLLKQRNEIDEKIRKMKEYIANKQKGKASTVKKNYAETQILIPEDNSQDVISRDTDGNPTVTEQEKQNSQLELNTIIQVDLSGNQGSSSVTTNLEIKKMDSSEISLLNPEQNKFDETMNDDLSPAMKLVESQVPNLFEDQIQNFLKGQKNPNSKEVQSAVSSRLTPQDETGNTTLPDSDPPKESCTTKKQDLTKAEQMALKKQMLLKQRNEIDEKIRKMKEYIANKQKGKASTVKKNYAETQILIPEDNSQDVISRDTDGNPTVTEQEKQNSQLELNTIIQVDLSGNQGSSSVTTNLEIKKMDSSEISLLNPEQNKFDETMNDDLSPAMKLVESQVPNLFEDQGSEPCSGKCQSTEDGAELDENMLLLD